MPTPIAPSELDGMVDEGVPPQLRWARERLDEARAQGLERRPRTREGGSASRAVIDGRPAVVFSANDYLGLATHPAVRRAAAEAALALGVGSTGSRHLSGCHGAIGLLEEELGAFLRCSAVTVAPSGHAANLAVLNALGGGDAIIFSDQRNHASIVDGCRLARAAVEVYAHRDLDDLERRLRCAGRRRIIVSDTVFSVDGSVADVTGLRDLARRHDAWLVLDEAHAVGTVGPGGRGLAAAAGIGAGEPNVVRVVTLSKALGSAGGAVCGAPEVRSLLLQRGRALIFSTAIPHPAVAAARTSLSLLRGEPGLVETLHARSLRLRDRLGPGRGGGVPPIPIVPVVLGEARPAVEAEARLLERGFLVQAVRPPTVAPGESRLRLCASAAHTEEEIDAVAAAVIDVTASFHAPMAHR